MTSPEMEWEEVVARLHDFIAERNGWLEGEDYDQALGEAEWIADWMQDEGFIGRRNDPS